MGHVETQGVARLQGATVKSDFTYDVLYMPHHVQIYRAIYEGK